MFQNFRKLIEFHQIHQNFPPPKFCTIWYLHVDVALTGICTVIVCKAHGNAKHVNTSGSGACPPGNFEKLHSKIESEGIFSD